MKDKTYVNSLLHSHPVGIIPPTDKCNSKVHVREAERAHPFPDSTDTSLLLLFFLRSLLVF